jgi:hypothetical protein
MYTYCESSANLTTLRFFCGLSVFNDCAVSPPAFTSDTAPCCMTSIITWSAREKQSGAEGISIRGVVSPEKLIGSSSVSLRNVGF